MVDPQIRVGIDVGCKRHIVTDGFEQQLGGIISRTADDKTPVVGFLDQLRRFR